MFPGKGMLTVVTTANAGISLDFDRALLMPRETWQAGRDKPRRGGAQGCAPFPEAQEAPYGNSRRACGPGGFIAGRDVGRLSFGYFSLPFKEVTRATRETLFRTCRSQ